MWFLIYLTLLNASANRDTFVNTYRLTFGFVYFNIMDATVVFGLLFL